MKFAVITAENVASNRIVSGLLEEIGPQIDRIFIAPNIPMGGSRGRRRATRLVRRANWRFVVFKGLEIYLSTLIRMLKGSTIAAMARKRGIPVSRISGGDDAAFLAYLRGERCDTLLSAGPSILPAGAFAREGLAVLNCHCARLPDYRGPANYIWMSLDEVERAHVSLQRMTPRIDEGPVIDESAIPRDPGWSVYEFNWRLADHAGRFYGAFCARSHREGRIATREDAMRAAEARPAMDRGFPDVDAFRRLRAVGIPLIRPRDLLSFY